MRRAFAAMVFSLGACGDALPGAPDAPLPPDANPAALVKVRYSTNAQVSTSGTVSLAGRRVYFLNPSGSLALVTETDAAGVATARLPDGGTVVIADVNAISVYVGAHGGDEIKVGPAPVDPPTSAPLTLRLKLFAPDDNMNRYVLHSTCAGGQGGITVGPPPHSIDVTSAINTEMSYLFSDCTADATQDLLLTTVDFNNVPVGYRYYPSTVLSTTGTSLTTIQSDDYVTVGSHLTVKNVPSSITNVTVAQQLWGRKFLTSTDEVFFQSFQPVVDGLVDTELPIPTPASARLVTRVTDESSANPGAQTVVQWGSASSATTVDFGANGITPLVSPARLDASTFTVHWNDAPTTAADPLRPDTVLLTMFANNEFGFTTVNVLGPYTVDETGAASLVLPRVAELLTAINSTQSIVPNLTKIRLGEDSTRLQLLLTGIDPFPIDSPSGHVTYETARTFSTFPD